ncbi:MAG: DNA mismatch repair protein MutS, partial [Bacilli bacterium]|nr:DNA mismatch repair protein MutS [Bacilli bacterium]
MKRSEVDIEKISPMMKQYLEIKKQYEDTIIFFRLGDFYEMFFEDAVTASHELELTLTGKNCGLEERVPMCGIPYHAYKAYLDKLIERGYKVAICEQITDPKLTKGMVEREVIQVVTKGTRLDDAIDSKDFNYIGSIYDFEYCYAISYIDVSTGYVYGLVIHHEDELLVKEIINRGIKEAIVNSKIDRNIVNQFREHHNILITFTDELYEGEDYQYIFKENK